MVGIEKGPQRSECTRSKTQWDTWVLIGKDNLFFLAKWQMSQQIVLLDCKLDTSLFSKDSFA